MSIGVGRGGIGRIAAGYRVEQQGRIGHASRHGARGILRMADRDDMRAADQADRGLEPDDTIDAGGTRDRSIGFGADGCPGEMRCDSRTTAGG